MYHFATWKYWLVIGVLLVGTLFALPNVFGFDPALQLSRSDRHAMDDATVQSVLKVLDDNHIKPNADYVEGDRLVIRLNSDADRTKARAAIQSGTAGDFTVALSKASRMPAWMRKTGFLRPMSLGLDLSGGVHFVYEVDTAGAVSQALETLERDVRTTLRDKNIHYISVMSDNGALHVVLHDPNDLDAAQRAITPSDGSLIVQQQKTADGNAELVAHLTDKALNERKQAAVEKNILTLRNRVSQLGISEPIVAKQGADRIVVELPGVEDPNQAIRILGATATLEFRMVDESNNAYEAMRTNRIPLGSKLYKRRDDGGPILLKREVVVSGDQLTDATSTVSEGQPAVSVKLDARGGDAMLRNTQQNVGKPMATVYIERKRLAPGEKCNGTRVNDDCTEESVINVATIRGVFSSQFQITGLQATEAKDLSLLLRSGSLAAPLTMVEQRTVGPSLGEENIRKGWHAMAIGLVLTFIFMAIYYRAFGWVANAVLLSNLVLTVGLLSMLQASLSLPGIAAVVFHLGIAVDANILIYERIREELRNGNSPMASINAGFDRAFATIFDSNITTLIAGLVLYSFGTGTIKSFAIVMTLGIATSLFTSVVGSRALVHFVWGRRRRLESLSI
ncbi:MAG TPA: protein translocase subunit SecD [Steroidobacteraceae bacterium]|nr:protein translocase subunit SecD [Steroidobacteraceae bacterium]